MEENVIVVFSEKLTTVNRTLAVLGHSKCHCQSLTSKYKVSGTCCRKLNLACVDLTSENNIPAWKETELLHLNQYIANNTDNTQLRPADVTGVTEKAANVLHVLADSIKYNANTTVLWDTSNAMPEIRSEMALFGVLRRLVDWHRASVYMMCDKEVRSEVDHWSEMLQGTIVTPECTPAPVLWRGSINIASTKSSINLQGFSLAKDQHQNVTADLNHERQQTNDQRDVITDSEVEVLGTVVRADLPAFYATDKIYTLRITSSSSMFQQPRDFIKILHENPQMCYVGRLKYGLSVKPPPPKSDSWQDTVVKDPYKLADYLEAMEFEGQTEYCYFMIHGSAGGQDGSCSAVMLHPPSTLDGSVMHSLALRHLMDIPNSRSPHLEQVESWVREVPSSSAALVMRAETCIQKAQVAVVTSWVEEKQKTGETTGMSAEELLSLLELTRMEVMKQLCPWTTQPQQRHQQSVLHPLPHPSSECSGSTGTQLEYVALLYRDRQQTSNKNPTSEALAGLSPPTKPHPVTLDAAEFLKLFNKDGTAAITDLEPVLRNSSPSKKLLRFHSGEKNENKETWPACLLNNTHGKHYHNGDEAEIIEKLCNKLKARLLPIETAGFFSSPSASVASVTATRGKAKARGKQGTPLATPTKARAKRSSITKRTPKTTPTSDQNSRRSQRVLQEKSKGKETQTQDSSRSSSVSRKESNSTEKSGSRSEKGREIRSTEKSAAGSQRGHESRSQRHKRRLEETVRKVLEKHSVPSDDPIFKSASQKLFELVKCYLKGLKTSHNLRQEMENLAELHALQVIAFEKKYR